MMNARPSNAALAGLLAAVLAVGGTEPATAHGPVGHTIRGVEVPAVTSPATRHVDVHLWYPADPVDAASRPRTVYRSALRGRQLPAPWIPLSWSVEAELAREGAAIDPRGGIFPVIVFTHGNVNDPIDYAHSLERIAAAGFIVAAPYHANNTQDDVRIDFINTQAGTQFPCSDGLPGPCSRTNVPISMADRVRDISKILDALPGWFGDRVDMERAGVLGHSRGTVTALAAAGGSALRSAEANCQPTGELCWPLEREPRVRAIMGMAIAVPTITRGADLANVTVPALLVAGTLDEISPPSVSELAYARITSADKRLVYVQNAVHRSFDSTYCDQLQASGAAFDTDRDGVVEAAELDTDGDGIVEASDVNGAPPILDRHTFAGILTSPTSGRAVQYCSFAAFTNPTDVRALVEAMSGFHVTADNVPTTGLETDEVKRQMTELAVAFFDTRLGRDRDGDRVPDAADNCPDTANGDQADADGDATGDVCDATPQGTTPPTIVVPGDITVDATGPAGATVAYTVTATDDLDPSPTVHCTPSAGSLFAIGDTAVECVATDAGGNQAHASFVISVLGATEQLARLIGKVLDATTLPAALQARLTAILRSLVDPSDARQRTAACLGLRAFITVVHFLAPPAEAAEWTADASRIRAVLAC